MVTVKMVAMALVMETTRAAARHGQHNDATLLTSPLLQCWRSVAVSHLLSFQRPSCGDHLCACLLGLAYLGGTLMAVLRDSELSGNAQTKASSCGMSGTPAAIWLP